MRLHCKHLKWLSIAAVLIVSLNAHAQVSVSLSPVGRQQFLSSTGAPLSAGCLYTWISGTTTPLTTYQDAQGMTPNANPIQLDSGGFATIFLSGSAYKYGLYQNPVGGACPGTPGGSLVLQWTLDGIKTSTGSGSGAATQLTSAGANPASTGIVAMTKSDSMCFRNAGNTGNICVSLDSANNLTWSGLSFFITEGACPPGVAAEDGFCADAAQHRMGMLNNGSAESLIVGQATTDTFTNKTLDTGGAGNVLKINGTQLTAVTGNGGVAVLQNAATLTTPTLQLGTTTPTTAGQIGYSAGELTIGDGTSNHIEVTRDAAETLTNKTLTSPVLTSPTLTGSTETTSTLTVNSHLSTNGTGLQHIRFTSCNPSTSNCTTSANWNATWADTNYSVFCTVNGTDAANVFVFEISSKTTTAINYEFANVSGGAGAFTKEIDCLGVHD